jgi:hypothetical protein
MTSDAFGEYMRLLPAHAPTDRTIHLVVDMHSSQRTQAVKNLAVSLNINHPFVPAGLTNALQPLDRSIFGALRSHARRLFRCQVRDNQWLRRTKHDAAQDMVAAWVLSYAETLEPVGKFTRTSRGKMILSCSIHGVNKSLIQ